MILTREVSFENAGTTLRGTLHVPARGTGRPGVVLVHGSGPGPRSSLTAHAEAFAREGIVALTYDKRTEGYSVTRRDYGLLAADALAAVRLLAAQPETDRERVGLWGFSEGGWVAPLAASRSDEIAYVVLVGASGLPPARQQGWALETYLRRNGVRGAMVDALAEVGIRQLAGAGLLAEAHHDGVPVLRTLRQPVLALWGQHDTVVPPGESLLIFREALAGNDRNTLRVVPGADHGVCEPGQPAKLAPGYVEFVASWITGAPAAARSETSAVPPVQAVCSRTIDPLEWWESTGVQCAALALFLIAFPGSLSRPAELDRVSRWAAVLGSVTVGGWIVYFLRITVDEKPALGPTFGGRTLPWLALQGTAAATVAATALTAVRARRLWPRLPGTAKARLGLLIVGGLAMVPWGRYWRLLRR
ncbi:alpha/beta hydrolase family protein [Lentzea rhizosphaerae]|uniref:Alpha/beta hydrolase family protein n=1 Tax=Lentzea rhizosphaerae TaxID=2041025 RepID=A0ABV8C8S2_9PSEU